MSRSVALGLHGPFGCPCRARGKEKRRRILRAHRQWGAKNVRRGDGRIKGDGAGRGSAAEQDFDVMGGGLGGAHGLVHRLRIHDHHAHLCALNKGAHLLGAVHAGDRRGDGTDLLTGKIARAEERATWQVYPHDVAMADAMCQEHIRNPAGQLVEFTIRGRVTVADDKRPILKQRRRCLKAIGQ